MTREGRAPALGTACLSAGVLGLAGALFDLSITVAFRPATLELAGGPWLAPAVLALLLAAVHLILWAAASFLTRLWTRLDRRVLAVALVPAVGAFLVGHMLHYGLGLDLWLEPLPGMTVAAVRADVLGFVRGMLALSAGVALAAGFVTHRLLARGGRPGAAVGAALAPLALAAGAGTAWAAGRAAAGAAAARAWAAGAAVATTESAGTTPGAGSAVGWQLAGPLLAALAVALWIRSGRRLRPRAVVCAFAAFAVLLAAILGGAWRASQRLTGQPEAAPRAVRRVILITVDTLRPDALSSFGGTVPTPRIDRLAADGVRFDGALSPSGWTLPAMASMLTGLSPLAHGVVSRDSSLPEALVTLPERLRAAGYRTAAIGNNVFLCMTGNVDQGFSRFDFFPKLLPGTTSVGSNLLWRVTRTDGRAPSLTDRARDWLREHRDADFFLWLHYLDPHSPYAPPADLRPAGAAPRGVGPEFTQFREARDGLFVPDPAQRAWIRGLYQGDVLLVDREIGRLLAALDELGLYDESLIVFGSDHGEELWEHDSCEHGHTLYDELLRVPLIFKLPATLAAGRRGQVVTAPVSTGSVTPTVLELCGLDPRPDREPRSYASLAATLIAGAPAPVVPLEAAGTLYFENRQAVTFDGLKYIRRASSGREELYDLRTDPGERESLVLVRGADLDRGRLLLEQLQSRGHELAEHYGVSATPGAVFDPQSVLGLKALGYVE